MNYAWIRTFKQPKLAGSQLAWLGHSIGILSLSQLHMRGMESIIDRAGGSADNLHLIWVPNVWVTILFLYFNLFCYIGLLFMLLDFWVRAQTANCRTCTQHWFNTESSLHLYAWVVHLHCLHVLFWLLEIQFSIISVWLRCFAQTTESVLNTAFLTRNTKKLQEKNGIYHSHNYDNNHSIIRFKGTDCPGDQCW